MSPSLSLGSSLRSDDIWAILVASRAFDARETPRRGSETHQRVPLVLHALPSNCHEWLMARVCDLQLVTLCYKFVTSSVAVQHGLEVSGIYLYLPSIRTVQIRGRCVPEIPVVEFKHLKKPPVAARRRSGSALSRTSE